MRPPRKNSVSAPTIVVEIVYRDGLKGGPLVARNFFLALPGYCLTKSAHLLIILCSALTCLVVDIKLFYTSEQILKERTRLVK